MRWRRMIMERVQQLQHLERDDLWVPLHMGSVSLVVVDVLVLAVHVVHLPHFILKKVDSAISSGHVGCNCAASWHLLHAVRADRLVSHSQSVMMLAVVNVFAVMPLMDVLTQQKRIWTCGSEDRVSSCGFSLYIHSIPVCSFDTFTRKILHFWRL